MGTLLEKFDDDARRAVLNARVHARSFNRQLIESSHLLLSLAADRETDAASVLREREIEFDTIYLRMIDVTVFYPQPSRVPVQHTPEFKVILQNACREAEQYGNQDVTPAHLLSAMLLRDMGTAREIVQALVGDLSAFHARVRSLFVRT